MNPRCLCWLAALLLAAPVATAADSWPEFRGPTADGQAPAGVKLPTEWSTTKNVVWKQPIPGVGWSSPVILDGKIYLTTAVPMGDEKPVDQSLRAICLDAASGKQLWMTEVFRQDGKRAPRIHNKNSHASPTPIVAGQRLYVHFGHEGTACLDLTGKVLWRNTDLRYSPVHGNGGSPILVGQHLIFSCDGGNEQFVVALDRDTGKAVWKTPRNTEGSKKFAFSTPTVITVNGQQQVISPGANVVCAYDPSNGRELWRARYEGYSVIPKPVYGHGMVFLGTGYDQPTFTAVRADGQGDVTDTHVGWTLKKAAPHTPSPLLDGELLYLISDRGIATCLTARTGDVVWQERIGGNFSASPLLADGKVYFQSEEGVGTVIKAGRQFERLARNDLGEATLASYAVANGALFIRTEKHLYRIQER